MLQSSIQVFNEQNLLKKYDVTLMLPNDAAG